jgi:hypothetical protein
MQTKCVRSQRRRFEYDVDPIGTPYLYVKLIMATVTEEITTLGHSINMAFQ